MRYVVRENLKNYRISKTVKHIHSSDVKSDKVSSCGVVQIVYGDTDKVFIFRLKNINKSFIMVSLL